MDCPFRLIQPRVFFAHRRRHIVLSFSVVGSRHPRIVALNVKSMFLSNRLMRLQMNMTRGEKTQPLLYAIVFLLVINIAITGWLALRSTQERIQVEATAELPDALGADERSRLFEEFRQPFNSGNSQAMFEAIHPLVRITMSESQTKEILSSLKLSFGAIGEYIYSHFIYVDYSGGFHTYNLIFRVKYSGGQSGATIGTVVLTVFDNGEETGISGINLR